MDLNTRRRLYNLCDPSQALAPDDPRNVDIDAETHARGESFVERLAREIELSTRPVCQFVTAVSGAGMTTEFRRLAARLTRRDGANLWPVIVDGAEVLGLQNPLVAADVLLAVLTETARTLADGGSLTWPIRPIRSLFDLVRPVLPVVVRRFLADLLRRTSPVLSSRFLADLLREVTEGSESGDLLEDLTSLVPAILASPPVRWRFREWVAQRSARFVDEVRNELILLQDRSRRQGRDGIVILVDGLTRLQGMRDNATEVLASAEQLFVAERFALELPVHVVYTVPPALGLVGPPLGRLCVLPMIQVRSRDGAAFMPGCDAVLEIVRRRIPNDALQEILGKESFSDRVQRLVEQSGGSPREIVALLREVLVVGATARVSAPAFERVLAERGDQVRRILSGEALRVLSRMTEKQGEPRLGLEEERVIAGMLLSTGALLPYRNAESWFGVHPSVRGLAGVET